MKFIYNTRVTYRCEQGSVWREELRRSGRISELRVARLTHPQLAAYRERAVSGRPPPAPGDPMRGQWSVPDDIGTLMEAIRRTAKIPEIDARAVGVSYGPEERAQILADWAAWGGTKAAFLEAHAPLSWATLDRWLRESGNRDTRQGRLIAIK